jgi:hypothetical protein
MRRETAPTKEDTSMATFRFAAAALALAASLGVANAGEWKEPERELGRCTIKVDGHTYMDNEDCWVLGLIHPDLSVLSGRHPDVGARLVDFIQSVPDDWAPKEVDDPWRGIVDPYPPESPWSAPCRVSVDEEPPRAPPSERHWAAIWNRCTDVGDEIGASSLMPLINRPGPHGAECWVNKHARMTSPGPWAKKDGVMTMLGRETTVDVTFCVYKVDPT